jgi:hypothetical protein
MMDKENILEGYRAMTRAQLDNEKSRLIKQGEDAQAEIQKINTQATIDKKKWIEEKMSVDYLLGLIKTSFRERNTGEKASEPIEVSDQVIEKLLAASPDFQIPSSVLLKKKDEDD